MAKIIERKCATCKEIIKIDRNNIKDVVIYNKGYHHKQCLIDHATQSLQKPRSNKTKWTQVLENIDEYEKHAQEVIGRGRPTDKLNDWLLEHYDITTTPSDRFWSIVRELGNGVYRNKRCKAIDVDSLTEAWKWAQHNLDKIAVRNKSMNNAMDGEARIHYDLAIILKKYPLFLKWKDKQKAAAAAAAQEVQHTKIDYSNLEKQALASKKDDNSLDDISDLLDELF